MLNLSFKGNDPFSDVWKDVFKTSLVRKGEGPTCGGNKLNFGHCVVIPAQVMGTFRDRNDRGECMWSFVFMHLSLCVVVYRGPNHIWCFRGVKK